MSLKKVLLALLLIPLLLVGTTTAANAAFQTGINNSAPANENINSTRVQDINTDTGSTQCRFVSPVCQFGMGAGPLFLFFVLVLTLFVGLLPQKLLSIPRFKVLTYVFLSANCLFLMQFLSILGNNDALPIMKYWFLIASIIWWLTIVFWFFNRKDHTYKTQMTSQAIALVVLLVTYVYNVNYVQICVELTRANSCGIQDPLWPPIIVTGVIILLGAILIAFLLFRIRKYDGQKILKVINKVDKPLNGKVSKFTNKAIVSIAAILAVSGIGYLFFNNIMQPKVDNTIPAINSSSSPSEIKACEKKIRDQYVAVHGVKWATDIDVSACNPGLIPVASLTQTQKDENIRNDQIMSDAAKSYDATKCDVIKGIYFTAYPANLTKVIPRTEAQAKEECKSGVAAKIKSDAQRAERMSHYFTLPGWDIKLFWDNPTDQAQYYAVSYDANGIPKTYEFTTKNTANQNACPINKGGMLGAVSRETDPKKVGKGVHLQTQIGKYYYWDMPPQKPCLPELYYGNDIAVEAAVSTRAKIYSMITDIQSQPTP